MNNEPVNPYKAITNTKIEPTVVSYTHPAKEKGLPRSNPLPVNQAYLTRSDDYTPVAWISESEFSHAETGGINMIVKSRQWESYDIPLYTHPAKILTDAEQDACFNRGYKEGARDILNKPAKTLTDEEIDDSVRQYFNIHSEAKLSEQFRIKLYELEDFARAILRKAQEK